MPKSSSPARARISNCSPPIRRLSHAACRIPPRQPAERLAVWDDLKPLAARPDCLVLDPDSRLTQLGLLPICDEDRYHLFESRAYGARATLNLPALAARWAAGNPRRPERRALHRRRPASGLTHRPTSPSAWESAKTPPSASPTLSRSDLLALLATRLPAGHRSRRRRRRGRPRRTRRRPVRRPRHLLGRKFRRLRSSHRRQQPLRRLRFRRAARGRRLRRAPDQHLRRLSRPAHVPPLAPRRPPRHRDPRGPSRPRRNSRPSGSHAGPKPIVRCHL